MANFLPLVPLFLTLLATSGQAQTSVLTEKAIWRDYPRLPYTNPTDSTAIQASADSVARLMAGRWELVGKANGWGPNSPPARATELVIDDQKRANLYLDGVWSGSFTLIITRRWSMIQFRTTEPGKPFLDMTFPLRQSNHGTHYQTGLIQVCEQKMVISDGMADGSAYAFRRVPINQPARQYTHRTIILRPCSTTNPGLVRQGQSGRQRLPVIRVRPTGFRYASKRT